MNEGISLILVNECKRGITLTFTLWKEEQETVFCMILAVCVLILAEQNFSGNGWKSRISAY